VAIVQVRRDEDSGRGWKWEDWQVRQSQWPGAAGIRRGGERKECRVWWWRWWRAGAGPCPQRLTSVARMQLFRSSWVRRVWEMEEWFRLKQNEPLNSDPNLFWSYCPSTFTCKVCFSVNIVRLWNGSLGDSREIHICLDQLSSTNTALWNRSCSLSQITSPFWTKW
jgi:hypothetical protein